MQARINLIWFTAILCLIAGCSNLNSHDVGICQGEACTDTESHVVPAIEPAKPLPAGYNVGMQDKTLVTDANIKIVVTGPGVYHMSSEILTYDKKVYHNGELIDIEQYLWEILPGEMPRTEFPN